jgi:hypothetical protein
MHPYLDAPTQDRIIAAVQAGLDQEWSRYENTLRAGFTRSPG